MRTNYVITIARNFGAGGKSVGLALSKELGIPCYERQILTMASEKSGIDEKLFVDMDERLNGGFLAKKLASMPFSTVLEPREKDFTSDNNLFNIQADILQTMARSESFIVIGKCADFVLRPYGNVINVFIEAPQSACIHTIMERTNVSEQRALQMYKKTNKYRSEYYNHYTYGGEWRDPMNYDLVLNSYKVGIDNCVKLSQSELRLPLLQVVSSNKYFSVGVQSPTEINAPRGRTLSGRQWFCATGTECRVQ